MKNAGMIKRISYGTWQTISKKRSTKTTKVGQRQLQSNLYFFPDKIRGHAFQFKVSLPKMRNWKNREAILTKNHIAFKELSIGGIKRGQKLDFRGRKVWLTNSSIIIYEKASYMADTAQESRQRAILDMLSLLRGLERHLRANFRTGRYYRFKVSRQHYAMVKNALAEQYDKEHRKLYVYSEDGLWFLIDNSYNLHEAEAVHSKTAVSDSKKIQDYFNGIKALDGYTPQFVVNSFGKVIEVQKVFDHNMMSHIKAIQDLSKGMRKFNRLLTKFNRKV